MSFTYAPSTDLGKVRMLITDRDEAKPIFQDDEITAFLELEGGSVRLAAATALETIAGDQALVLKVLVLLDTETDGAKVCEALLSRAKVLREAEANIGALEIAEFADTPSAYASRLWKQAQRGVI